MKNWHGQRHRWNSIARRRIVLTFLTILSDILSESASYYSLFYSSKKIFIPFAMLISHLEIIIKANLIYRYHGKIEWSLRRLLVWQPKYLGGSFSKRRNLSLKNLGDPFVLLSSDDSFTKFSGRICFLWMVKVSHLFINFNTLNFTCSTMTLSHFSIYHVGMEMIFLWSAYIIDKIVLFLILLLILLLEFWKFKAHIIIITSSETFIVWNDIF